MLDRAPLLPAVFEGLKHPDGKVRRTAAWTLEALASDGPGPPGAVRVTRP